MFDNGFLRPPHNSMADLSAYLRSAGFTGDLSTEPDLISDSLVVRFTVLGQPEVLKFSSNIEPKEIVHAIWLLRETREAAVGPEFHQAARLARRNFAAVDPYGRPA